MTGFNEQIKAAWRRWNDEKYAYPATLSGEQEQVLLGSLLGDGCLFYKTKGATAPSFAETHSGAQKDYLAWKHERLLPFGARLREQRYTARPPQWYLSTGTVAAFIPWHQAFYVAGKSVVPDGALGRLAELGLAIWFMDDGSWSQDGRFTLSTDAYPLESQNRLSEWFTQRWSVTPHIQFLKTQSSYRLVFKRADSVRLLRLIEPHLHPLFREKWRLDDPMTFRTMTRLESIHHANRIRSQKIAAGTLKVPGRRGNPK